MVAGFSATEAALNLANPSVGMPLHLRSPHHLILQMLCHVVTSFTI